MLNFKHTQTPHYALNMLILKYCFKLYVTYTLYSMIIIIITIVSYFKNNNLLKLTSLGASIIIIF